MRLLASKSVVLSLAVAIATLAAAHAADQQAAMDKAILAAWQATKMIEWKPDAEAWARYVADEFMIINNTTIRNKPERVAIARKHQETGVGTPGDPILAMEIADFGDNAAVMIS